MQPTNKQLAAVAFILACFVGAVICLDQAANRAADAEFYESIDYPTK